MPADNYLPNYRGVQKVYHNQGFTLFRAVDNSSGRACWVYRAARSMADEVAFKKQLSVASTVQMRRFRHHHSLPWQAWSIDSSGRPLLAVEHCPGQPWAALQTQQLSQQQRLYSLLQLVRLARAAQSDGLCNWVLHPGLLFLTCDQQVRGEEIADLKVVLMPAAVADHFADLEQATGVVTQAMTPGDLGQLFLNLFGLEGQRQLALLANLGSGDPWQSFERQLLLALSGYPKTILKNTPCAALATHLKQSPWQLMDCFTWSSGAWHCALLYRGDSQCWQQVLITAAPAVNPKPQLEKLLGMAGLPELFDLQGYWLLPGGEWPWLCLLVPQQPVMPISERLMPMPLADTSRVMTGVCQQLEWLQSCGIELPELTLNQVLVVGGQAKVLPISVVSSGFAWPKAVKSLMAQVASLALWLNTAQTPRWFNGQLQLGRRFNALPQRLRSLLQQCLDVRAGRQLTLAQMAEVFASCAQAEPPQPSPSKVMAAPKQEGRKKLLLFLLLILLFQSLVNVGIIVIFN